MDVGQAVRFDHTEFYCKGWGQRCTLAHYTSLLKTQGVGEWKIEHESVGMAIVLRTR
jgi:hypothetical protein|tara:strand:+ start:376 stop:546 length:171 start_codon:yes stop_codon:yes gene_type:complete